MKFRNFFMFAICCAASTVFAQNYPTKPIRLVVPFAPGGTTDIIARILAEPLSRSLGQTVIVENKSGAGGIIGATETARARPDGYSLGIATVSTVASNPAINSKIPYNPLTDFTPIVNIAATPNILAVHPSFPAKNYADFLTEVTKSPNKYAYASSGTGGILHLQMELYKSLSGAQLMHVPYKGSGPALNDTVAGQVPMVFDNLPSVLGFIKQNRLVPIVVAAPQRVAALPDVPTFKEVGLETANRMAFFGIYGPKGISKEITDKVNAAVLQALQDPAVRQRIEDTGAMIVGNSPEQFAEEIKAEFAIYKQLVEKQKLAVD